MELTPIQDNQEPEYPPIKEYFWRRPCFKKKLALGLVSVVGLGGMVAAGAKTVEAIIEMKEEHPQNPNFGGFEGIIIAPRPPLPPTGAVPALGATSTQGDTDISDSGTDTSEEE